ncbi:hypothetical protein AG0111_0g13165 [Alternaria gaisen]|uniref:Uncharacterized protein n=1 Tax=Alternaria gaisen TaxID=167740 RepID=A0ACB6F2I3_9PLEO|nr:hypothetical protein AG0111_0g13165 [Alternaria gaisen]
MGKQLLERDSLFIKDIRVMDELLQKAQNPPSWTIEEEILRPQESSRIYQAQFSQPICTALQIAIFKFLKRCGIPITAVVGHSSGEIAASYACGALSLREAMLCSYSLGLVTGAQELTGGMAAVGMSSEEVLPYLNENVLVAAENSPKLTTISGPVVELNQVMNNIRKNCSDSFLRRLQVDMAYHSREMHTLSKPYLDLLYAEFNPSTETSRLPRIPMYSTVTGKLVREHLSPEYWVQNLVSPVRYMQAIREILTATPQCVFLEIGPHPQLASPILQICVEANIAANYIPTLIRGVPCEQSLLTTVGKVWQQGIHVDFTVLFPPGPLESET